MNREIKFRAWDEEAEEMAFSDKQSDDYNFGIEDGIFKAWFTEFRVDQTDGHAEPISEELSPLMQYTGLKDKRGKKIYEGDLLRVQSQYETDEPIDSFPNKVEFKDGAFRCGFHDMILGEKVCSGSSGNWSCEIIGNIYENPELLKP